VADPVALTDVAETPAAAKVCEADIDDTEVDEAAVLDGRPDDINIEVDVEFEEVVDVEFIEELEAMAVEFDPVAIFSCGVIVSFPGLVSLPDLTGIVATAGVKTSVTFLAVV